jgi:hypothetical protein
MTERSELVERYLGIFLRHMEQSAPNSATADNASRAAESLVDAVREEGRRGAVEDLAELQMYREAAVYDACMGGATFRTWNRSALDRARKVTEQRKESAA